eukprot:m.223990 g.223990  ORF g.223990 m.223990 type:complete len:2153 (-) comp26355_c0_seq2:43-6501(-)
MGKKATLVLADGSRYEGHSFGAAQSVAGETVFQTGMVGYCESLTDPSYEQQLLVLTYPLVGNYGVPGDERDEHKLPVHFEADKIHARALIVSTLSEDWSHWAGKRSLSEWLAEQGIPGITGIDTRALTKKLRVDGSMLGKIIIEGDDEANVPFHDPNKENLVAAVSTKEPKEFNQDKGDVNIVVVDTGLKNNQLRCLIKRGAKVKMVPWDYDFSVEKCDGVFLSNGPGDPAMCDKTVEHLRRFLKNNKTIPLFGICLGHQLLSIAAGGKTFKMAYGNRGHNQPCVHKDTQKCYITSQNHGFATDPKTLPDDWQELFTNANDGTNEGIVHKTKPYFSVQFHPEATAGPEDLECLFDVFLARARNHSIDKTMPEMVSDLLLNSKPCESSPGTNVEHQTVLPAGSKVLVLGSGGLSIGQAGEFDYSGSQAIKALQEDKMKTVLINPNIATVQTMKGLADKVYFLPVTPEYVEKVIEHERPDGVLLTFGGQTALNCGIELEKRKIFSKFNVKVLGTPVATIVNTEDREEFSKRLAEINESICPNIACTCVDEVLAAADKVGYPVMMRSSFALGGLGSGVVHNKDDLRQKATVAFSNTTQVMIERSLQGWKEIEYEVVRDAYDNTITVCNMENFDPLGIHTGESIVVAPSQTLNNHEYNLLRSVACKVVRHLGVVGECNIQYALNPESSEYFIIEVNARLSRSSALASKATGYPLAFVAAKLGLGTSLVELRNAVTKKTTACFEPSLDYCVVKIPRWDMSKFPTVSSRLGTSMKSVGEVMAIGRTFEEAFQKAIRMVDIGVKGFDAGVKPVSDEELQSPNDQRPLVIASALAAGYTIDRLYNLTKIDKWFLAGLKNIVDHATKLSKFAAHDIPVEDLRRAKQLGFADSQIAHLTNTNDLAIRKIRKQHSLRPFVRQIDTVAAEYPAYTNYLYLTYNSSEDDVTFEGGHTMVLGSGVYRIGSSVEFDYCSVGCVRELRRLGHKTIMMNYNPETVSTDYDECDRLYFDQLTLESVLDVYELEDATGIILAMGGQIPNNLATSLMRANVRIFGTSPEMIDGAENRYKFSRMCDSIGVDQPKWKELTSVEDARHFANEVGFPCLIRPSYILSGTAMRVVHSDADLENDLKEAVVVSRDYPVVISRFITDAKEIEVDAVAQEGQIIAIAISEHIENAGIHSGDATIVHPPQDLTSTTMEGVELIARRIAKALQITGPMNIQFIAKDDKLKVIECNVRASRSFPFVSKTMDVDLIAIATQAMVGVEPTVHAPPPFSHVGVKVPQFSFNRLSGADPTLGVDMISTGEVACFGKNKYQGYLKAMLSTGFTLPKKNILLTIGTYAGKAEFLASARALASLGYTLFGSLGTADYYQEHSIPITPVDWLREGEDVTSIAEQLLGGNFHLIINLPLRNKYRRPASYMTSGARVRTMAVEHRVPLITNIKCAKLFVEVLKTCDLKANVSPDDCQTAKPLARLPLAVDASFLIIDPSGTDVDWDKGSQAALSGGYSLACLATYAADSATFLALVAQVKHRTRCDFAMFLAASPLLPPEEVCDTMGVVASGLVLDLESVSYDVSTLMQYFELWPVSKPIVVVAGGHQLASVLFFANTFNRSVHIRGIRTDEQLNLIGAAKRSGGLITCSVDPVWLCTASAQETAPIWNNLEVVDVFATESTTEREYVAMEAALPLLLTAVARERLTLDDVIARIHTNPLQALGLQMKRSEDHSLEAFLQDPWKLPSTSKFEDYPCPLAGRPVLGRVSRVLLQQKLAYLDGKLFVQPGTGNFIETLLVTSAVKPTKPAAISAERQVSIAAKPQPRMSRRASFSEDLFDDFEPLPAVSPSRRTAMQPAIMRTISGTSKTGVLKGHHILSVKQFTRPIIHELYNWAHQLRVEPDLDLLRGKVLASIFYEPSSRTSSSFTSAMQRLGGTVVAINQISTSSVAKGETLPDFIRTMECYSDAIVLRHPERGSLQIAASHAHKPVINAGDGTGEHPTQALLDVFTIREELGTVNGLHIALVGDLKHGRTVHSLARLLLLYRVASIRCVAPASLAMPESILKEIRDAGVVLSMHTSVEEVIADIDVLYVTRIQKERFNSVEEYNSVKGSFVITPKTLTDAKSNMIVMHPLPRVDEISVEVDTDRRAAYFRQMEYGVYVRMALLGMVLGKL